MTMITHDFDPALTFFTIAADDYNFLLLFHNMTFLN
jgi:hypothetical protein